MHTHTLNVAFSSSEYWVTTNTYESIVLYHRFVKLLTGILTEAEKLRFDEGKMEGKATLGPMS